MGLALPLKPQFYNTCVLLRMTAELGQLRAVRRATKSPSGRSIVNDVCHLLLVI
jgi:hypothetical protein